MGFTYHLCHLVDGQSSGKIPIPFTNHHYYSEVVWGCYVCTEESNATVDCTTFFGDLQ